MRHPAPGRETCHASGCRLIATVRLGVECRFAGGLEPDYEYETYRCPGCAVALAAYCLDYPVTFGQITLSPFPGDPGE